MVVLHVMLHVVMVMFHHHLGVGGARREHGNGQNSGNKHLLHCESPQKSDPTTRWSFIMGAAR
jgi:hypothetical protein